MLPLATNPTMKRLAQPGRYVFAIPFAAFGVQYFLYGHYPGARLACLLLGLIFFLRTVRLHTPRVATHLNSGDEWSGAFIALAMAGASSLLPLFPART
jgi:hypothetical protein